MPELPDITIYIEALESRITRQRLTRARMLSPFILRSVEPEPERLENLRCVSLRRLGKRIAIEFESDLWAVIHLMIAGRLQWRSDWPERPTRAMAALSRLRHSRAADSLCKQ
jgi:formamidopyrimidine-DNA glycosylase